MLAGAELRSVVEALTGPQNRPGPTSWRVVQVLGGSNSKAWRITKGTEDYLIKIPATDGRQRADREAAALGVLEAAGVPRVPRLVYQGALESGEPLLIQTWLDGEVLERPPVTDADWEQLLEHLRCAHDVLEAEWGGRCPSVGMAQANVERPNEELRAVLELAAPLRPTQEHDGARRFVEDLVVAGLSEWDPPGRVLCRIDHFTRNYLRTSQGFGSVDWEYAGWGDPAGDLAELVSHPSYLDESSDRWRWLLDRYEPGDGQTFRRRYEVCLLIRLAHWAVRCGRAASGVPVPSDRKRMGDPGFRQTSQQRYERYLAWAATTAKQVL